MSIDPNHVPGVMRCAKCSFVLHRVTLHALSGGVSAGGNETEPCPNGCGPLWPMTWRQQAEELQERAEEQLARAVALEAALDKAHEAAEISECRIAEVYDRIVKARDLIRAQLSPGRDDFARAAFNLLQEAKYGLGGRTNVAASVAQLKRSATAGAEANSGQGET